jgi:hypothetical protein
MVVVPFIRKRDLRGLNKPTLSAQTIQLIPSSNTLDLFRRSNGQLKNVMYMFYFFIIYMAYRAFWR